MKNVFRATIMCLALAGFAKPASADWLFIPYVGVTFGQSANFGDVGSFSDNLEKKVTFGGTISWMGAGIIGVEADLGSTPNFFQNTTGDANFHFGDGNVTTFMGNLVLGAPIGGQSGPGFRPYISGGAGLMRTNVSATSLFDGLSENDLGVDIGAGAHGFFSDNFGLRADVRYFRSLTKGNDGLTDLHLNNFGFWRGTLGVTFRFGH